MKGAIIGCAVFCVVVSSLGPVVAEQRINQGVTSGQLTAAEAARLAAGEDRIEKRRQHAFNDGEMTIKERRKLNRQANRQSRKIYRAKHN